MPSYFMIEQFKFIVDTWFLSIAFFSSFAKKSFITVSILLLSVSKKFIEMLAVVVAVIVVVVVDYSTHETAVAELTH